MDETSGGIIRAEPCTELYNTTRDNAPHYFLAKVLPKTWRISMQNDARLTPLVLVDHGIAADQGSFEPATTLLPPPGFCKYFL